MTLTSPLSEGVTYYVRVLPAMSPYTDSGTVAWGSTARVYPLFVVAADMDDTPGWLAVTVSNGEPGGTVTFSIDGGPVIFGSTLDDFGQLLSTAVPVGELAVGSHTVIVNTALLAGTATFAVANDPPDYPVAPVADVGPAGIIQTGVTRWVLQDPTTGGAQYIFPINPHKMSGPYAARVFTTDHSLAMDGQPLTFEGSPIGVDWTFEGTCRTQEFHDELEEFLAIPRRLYLHDHLKRAWTVTLESIAWTRLPEVYNDWAFTYVAKAIIYAGPVSL